MDREAFMDFYCDFSDEDPRYIHEYLVEEGIDIEGLQARLLALVAKHEAERKLSDGREFKLVYEEKKERVSLIGKGDFQDSKLPGAAVAYRKLNGEAGEDEKESANDLEKLRLIKEAKEASKKEKKNE